VALLLNKMSIISSVKYVDVSIVLRIINSNVLVVCTSVGQLVNQSFGRSVNQSLGWSVRQCFKYVHGAMKLFCLKNLDDSPANEPGPISTMFAVARAEEISNW
jgi:hypothetical protein